MINNISMKNQPILSICIPTWNRANYLEEILSKFANNSESSQDIEFVISDNASTDNTEVIVSKFQDRLPIIYKKNENNIKDQNFIKVMDLAHGKYLKLLNDMTYYDNYSLSFIKNALYQALNTKSSVLFASGCAVGKNDTMDCRNVNDLLAIMSTWLTWNNIFGCWKDDWELIKDKEKYASLKLMQVDWACQIAHMRNIIIYNNPRLRFASTFTNVKRGGYNWFEVHLNNYYKILDPYIQTGEISNNVLRTDKIRLLKKYRHELVNIYCNLYKDKYWCYDTKGTFGFLWTGKFFMCIFLLFHYGDYIILQKI